MGFGSLIVIVILITVIEKIVRFVTRVNRESSRPVSGGSHAPGRPTTLEELLAEMRRHVDSQTPEATPELIGDEAQSLESEVVRPEREVVDFDADIEAVIARRAQEAASRDGALTDRDHQLFDMQVHRRPPPPAKVGATPRPDLRQAMLWNEILGSPKGLRRD